MELEKINTEIEKSTREQILDFEEGLKQFPDAFIGDSVNCPLTHKFSDGIYVREIFIPKGTLLTGKIHKHSHPNVLLKGEASVFTEEDGEQRLVAPISMISKAGTKRVVYAHTDVTWITYHNVGEETDLEKIEGIVIAKNYKELANWQQNKIQMKTEITNCGLVALRNVSDMKNISIRSLLNIAEDNSLNLYCYKVPFDEISDIVLPAIFHSENHFTYIETAQQLKNITPSGYVLTSKTYLYYEEPTEEELKNRSGSTWVAVGIAGTALTYKIYDSEKKKSDAKKALAKIQEQPFPTYLTGEQVYNKANSMATGLSPQEKSAEQQNYNRLATQRYRIATDTNPTLSGAVNAGINYGSVQNTLGLAAMDASARRSSLHSLIGLIGGQANLETGSLVRKRMAEEQAYGGAIQAQGYNENQAIDQASNTATLLALNNQNRNQNPQTGNQNPQTGTSNWGFNYGGDPYYGWGGGSSYNDPYGRKRQKGFGLDGSYGGE